MAHCTGAAAVSVYKKEMRGGERVPEVSVGGLDVERAAEVLAEHALLLVGAGSVAAFLLFAIVLASIRVARRFQPFLLALARDIVTRRVRHPSIGRAFSPVRALVPEAYLALHLGLGLGAVAAASAFVVLAQGAVGGGEVAAFDVAFTEALQRQRTPRWDAVFRALTAFGSTPVLTLVTTIGSVLLFVRNERVLAFGWIAAQAGGGLLNHLLKNVFERTRPEFADAALAAASWSFPSGHAMGTVVLCGVGCYVLARRTRSWTAVGVSVAVASSWCLLMGFSRVYLGVHFASDVIAGVIAGGAWVAVCISGLEVVRPRRLQS